MKTIFRNAIALCAWGILIGLGIATSKEEEVSPQFPLDAVLSFEGDSLITVANTSVFDWNYYRLDIYAREFSGLNNKDTIIHFYYYQHNSPLLIGNVSNVLVDSLYESGIQNAFVTSQIDSVAIITSNETGFFLFTKTF